MRLTLVTAIVVAIVGRRLLRFLANAGSGYAEHG